MPVKTMRACHVLINWVENKMHEERRKNGFTGPQPCLVAHVAMQTRRQNRLTKTSFPATCTIVDGKKRRLVAIVQGSFV